MSNVIPAEAEPVFDSGMVIVAAESLRHFAGDQLDRDRASELIAFWRYHSVLSETEIAAVLARFDAPAPAPRHDGWHAGGRVLHGASRLAEPGEVCGCGLAATVVYVTDRGEVGFCGVNRV